MSKKHRSTPPPDAAGERTPLGDGILRLAPGCLAALLERGLALRPGGFVRVFFQADSGLLGVRLDREGDFRLRGRADRGIWIRSPLFTADRLRAGPYRLAFPAGVDFALTPLREESRAETPAPAKRRRPGVESPPCPPSSSVPP